MPNTYQTQWQKHIMIRNIGVNCIKLRNILNDLFLIKV